MLKLAPSASLISQDMDMHCQSFLELLPCLGRKHNSIDLLNSNIYFYQARNTILKQFNLKSLTALPVIHLCVLTQEGV